MENSEKSYPKQFLHRLLSSFLANDMCWLQCYGRRLHIYLDLLSLIRKKKKSFYIQAIWHNEVDCLPVDIIV